MEIADKIYQHVKAMPTEMANEVFNFIEFLEFKHGITKIPLERTEETTYILNNPSLMQQIVQSQQTFQQGTGYAVIK
jgi:hypothetical protein